jgi:hypothetical protein
MAKFLQCALDHLLNIRVARYIRRQPQNLSAVQSLQLASGFSQELRVPGA